MHRVQGQGATQGFQRCSQGRPVDHLRELWPHPLLPRRDSSGSRSCNAGIGVVFRNRSVSIQTSTKHVVSGRAPERVQIEGIAESWFKLDGGGEAERLAYRPALLVE